MIALPGLEAKCDAWNRIVEVRNDNGKLVASCEYNGLNQQIAKKVDIVATKSSSAKNGRYWRA